MIQKSFDGRSSLYLIPTPIGNLDDITVRALKTLQMVDFILCEDTRETSKLLNSYDIKKKLVSCHEYNEEKIKANVIESLKEGKNIGLVTDQGTPVVSDPGYVIVREVIRNNFNVISLPGATAFVPALTASGIEPAKFLFYGFLNAKNAKQKSELEGLKNLKYTIIFYESVHRIHDTLQNILEVFGDREVAIGREISKVHEEYIRGKLSEVIKCELNLKGEFVIIVEGNKEITNYDDISVINHVKLYVNDGMSENEAIKKVAKERNVAKSLIYKEYHMNK